jgi:hypothetical protein
VHDMHIGVITSSLGGRGAPDQCPATGPMAVNPANPALNAHYDDRGELINRGGVAGDPTIENTVADATSPDNFLSWFPTLPANMGKPAPPTTALTMAGAPVQSGTLIGDFTQIIEGVHEHGCGFEAQNEAWYRFLVQPDPYDSITLNGGKAQLNGVDATILKQRADFLRSDSLVAVIVVTDENEEAADPLAIGGQGWAFDSYSFPGGPGQAPEGTIECTKLDPNNPTTTGPNDPACTSCAFIKSDPNFATRCPPDGAGGMNGYYGAANDSISVRFLNQKMRFGLFAGYPTSRYIRGLTKTTVPSAAREHDPTGNYVGDNDLNANCVNPLFAQNLPTDPTKQDTCKLQRGPRTPDLIYYAAIAGVPHQLLQAKPGDSGCPAGTNPADCPQKGTLSASDWTQIQGGQDPEHYDFRGADFHMVESTGPRVAPAGQGVWASTSSCPPTSPNDCDPVNGREWTTSKQDLQFSCIFDLRPQFGGKGKDCTDPKYNGACDCQTATSGGSGYNVGTQLCDTQTPTLQVNGKAYPSIREMVIAHAMAQQNAQNGGQGIVSSLCPIHVTEQTPGDPLYGYRPAVNAIVDRLKTALSTQCVPQKLAPRTCGDVPCVVLVSLINDAIPGKIKLCKNPGTACSAVPGLSVPADPNVAAKFCDAQEALWNPMSRDAEPFTVPLCELNQLYQVPAGAACPGVSTPPPSTFDANGSCAGSKTPGWCYVTGAAAGGCRHSILFTTNEPPAGAIATLQCAE